MGLGASNTPRLSAHHQAILSVIEASPPTLNLGALLEASGAILRGHFLLSSGRHSDVYFEKFRILERPELLSAFCGSIAQHFGSRKVEVVAGPLTGGVLVALETARQLNATALYIENENGRKALRRGARVEAGTRVLLVDDVLTTGLSLRESLQVLLDAGAEVVGIGVLIDRSEAAPAFNCPLFAAYRVEARSYAPNEVPDDLAAVPVTKPGTREFSS